MADATVTIVNDRISVTPDPLPVTGKNVNLHWNIRSDGWTFPTNGIVIDDPGDQFSDPEVSNNGKKFKWKDKDDNKAKYKYTINVRNGARTLRLDPTIENQNGG